jgi:2-phospho-L-lactate guanylyltransferase
MDVTALIPVKGFTNAKQRLSALLGPREREQLAEAMLRDLLRELAKVRGLAATCVVTGDSRVAAIAREQGATVSREPSERGETPAVDFARQQLKRSGCDAVLILPGDIPLARSGDIEEVLGAVGAQTKAPFALLVPSHDRMGTNALFLAPPDVIALRFGYDSFGYHMSQVSAQGLTTRFLENERIALDIDEPGDLERFMSYGQEGETFRLTCELLGDGVYQRRRGGSL